MSVTVVNNENFEQEVLKSDKTVLLDFWADWCGPCQMLSPLVDEIAEENDNVKVCKINVDDSPELAGAFKISSIPTLAVIKDGRLADISVGFIPKAKIEELIK